MCVCLCRPSNDIDFILLGTSQYIGDSEIVLHVKKCNRKLISILNALKENDYQLSLKGFNGAEITTMVFAVFFICICLLQDFTLTECQMIRDDNCPKDATVEDVMIKMKILHMKTLEHDTKFAKMISDLSESSRQQKQLEKDLMETRTRLAEAEKYIAEKSIGRICKLLFPFSVLQNCILWLKLNFWNECFYLKWFLSFYLRSPKDGYNSTSDGLSCSLTPWYPQIDFFWQFLSWIVHNSKIKCIVLNRYDP